MKSIFTDCNLKLITTTTGWYTKSNKLIGGIAIFQNKLHTNFWKTNLKINNEYFSIIENDIIKRNSVLVTPGS